MNLTNNGVSRQRKQPGKEKIRAKKFGGDLNLAGKETARVLTSRRQQFSGGQTSVESTIDNTCLGKNLNRRKLRRLESCEGGKCLVTRCY